LLITRRGDAAVKMVV